MEHDEVRLRSMVESAGKGDVDAWEWLYRRMYQRLFSYARRRLSNDSAADDAVSETMTRALTKIEAFRWQGAGFEGWMFGICRNVVLESQRASGRTTALDDVDRLGPSDEQGPAQLAEAGDDRARLLDAFTRLDPAEQEVLELRIVAELSAEATGEVIGKQAGAVRMSQSRALSRLRTLFRETARD
jgi:RNA polymerase sigma-70 factor (ECF subfamily)